VSCNSRRRQPTVVQVNLFHTSFTVRQYITVKEVRLNSSRGSWNSCYHALPQYGDHSACHVKGTVIVCRKPCNNMGTRARRCSRPSPRGVGQGGTRARGLGARTRHNLHPRPRGVGRGGACARALVILGDLLYFLFCDFLFL